MEVGTVCRNSKSYVWILMLPVFEEMLCDVDEDVMPSIECVSDCAIKEEPIFEHTTASTQQSLSQLSLVKEEGQ
jgi:hypothetical protein